MSSNSTTSAASATTTSDASVYSGSCACGAVSISVPTSVVPLVQAYCHCNSCRVYNQAPINSAIVLPRKNNLLNLYFSFSFFF